MKPFPKRTTNVSSVSIEKPVERNYKTSIKKMQRNSDFSTKVRAVVRGISRGSTMSYKEVATRAGNPKASRAVAMIMSRNDDMSIPCHRVICSNGTIGGYNGLRKSTKRQLLQEEGIKFK
jgi:methylated-DNA-[protein]-cysteine S-methyltransferase